MLTQFTDAYVRHKEKMSYGLYFRFDDDNDNKDTKHDIPHGFPIYNIFYSTGVQIVNCTLSSDSVLSDSTGLFNPVLSVSANEIAFDKKISQSECVFQLMLGLEEHYSPPPLGDFSRIFWRPNWNIIQIMTLKCDLFFKCN